MLFIGTFRVAWTVGAPTVEATHGNLRADPERYGAHTLNGDLNRHCLSSQQPSRLLERAMSSIQRPNSLGVVCLHVYTCQGVRHDQIGQPSLRVRKSWMSGKTSSARSSSRKCPLSKR